MFVLFHLPWLCRLNSVTIFLSNYEIMYEFYFIKLTFANMCICECGDFRTYSSLPLLYWSMWLCDHVNYYLVTYIESCTLDTKSSATLIYRGCLPGCRPIRKCPIWYTFFFILMLSLMIYYYTIYYATLLIYCLKSFKSFVLLSYILGLLK